MIFSVVGGYYAVKSGMIEGKNYDKLEPGENLIVENDY